MIEEAIKSLKQKFGSTEAGYDMGRYREKNPWWQHPFFPLVPQIEWREGNEWNANNWSFCWLWFRVWSLEHFAFELSVEIEQTGINAKAIIGWLRVVVRVLPMPYGWLDWLQRNPAIKK